MAYPYANHSVNWTNITGVYDVVKLANDETNTLLVLSLLVSVFFVIFLALKSKDFDPDEILASAGWVCFILALFARFADLANLYPAIIFLVISAGATFYMVVNKRY